MALSEFGSLTREFYIVENGTWENYGGKEYGGLWGGDITRFYCNYNDDNRKNMPQC